MSQSQEQPPVSFEALTNELYYYQNALDDRREHGYPTEFYKNAVEDILGEIALQQMGDVTGPGSTVPDHGAYHGCDRPGERYPTNAQN